MALADRYAAAERPTEAAALGGTHVRERVPALLLGAIVLMAPYDVAIPEDGFGPLYLRPLMLVVAALAGVMIVVSPRPPQAVVIGATTLLGALWAASALADEFVQSAATAVRITIVVLVGVAAATVYRQRPAQAVLRRSLIVSVMLASTVGIVTHVVGGEVAETEHLLGDISLSNGVLRLTRPFAHANVAAMFLGPAVVLIALRDRHVRPQWPSWVGWSAAALGTMALSLTLSSAGLVATIVGLLIGAWWNRGTPNIVDRLFPILLAAYLAASRGLYPAWDQRLVFDPGPSGSRPRPLSRPEIWEQAWGAFTASPIHGLGPGQFGGHSALVTPEGFAAAPHAHSILLEVLATGGLVLLVPLMAMVTALGRRVWELRTTHAALSAAIVAIAAHGLVDYGVVFTSTGTLFAVLIGAALGGRIDDHAESVQ